MGNVLIIGGGAAGMQAAVSLSELGHKPIILEKEQRLGGKLRNWHKLFPSFTPAQEVLSNLLAKIAESKTEIRTSTEVSKLTPGGVMLTSGETMEADAVIIASGFDIFDARLKEEYGYGLYENVVTTVDLERMFNEGEVKLSTGRKPERIALLHCVGSRDEKVCQNHCSRVCCVTGVKQAIELKKMFPEADIYNFYMDIRMFGPGYEEMYRTAQRDHNIHFVRGRISEAGQTIDNKIQIKAEDTLVGRPLKMSVDMLVLIVGMRSGRSNAQFAKSEGIELSENGFLATKDLFTDNVGTALPSVFCAGAVTAPKNIGESINEGAAAALKVARYLNEKNV